MQLGYRLEPGALSKKEIDAYSDERQLERLRRTIRSELRTHPGQEALAREIGVGRIVLRKFVEQRAMPTPPNLKKIREWAENRPPMWTPLGSVLLATIVRDLPGAERARVRREIAYALADSHRRSGQQIPDWVKDEIYGTLPPRV